MKGRRVWGDWGAVWEGERLCTKLRRLPQAKQWAQRHALNGSVHWPSSATSTGSK